MKTFILILVLSITAFAQQYVTLLTKNDFVYSLDKESIVKEKDNRKFTGRIFQAENLLYGDFSLDCKSQQYSIIREYGLFKGFKFMKEALKPEVKALDKETPLYFAYLYVCDVKVTPDNILNAKRSFSNLSK